MARYIDADKLLKKSFRIEGHFDLPSGKAQNFSAICDTEIMNFPTADVVPVVHAHWNAVSADEFTEEFKCGNCNNEISLNIELYNDPKPRYCPNCGAKMDGDKNE